MITEKQCRRWHIPLGGGWTLENSPMVAAHDYRAGGTSVILLGEPRCGKTRALFRRAKRLYPDMRLWVRLHLDTSWVEEFGTKAVVWLPVGHEIEIVGESVRVEHYTDYQDLLRRAKKGEANILAWATDALNRWVDFLEELLRRDKRELELVLDDEVQQEAPEGATSEIAPGESCSPYRRVCRMRVILEQGPKVWISFLLSSHQAHDTDYRCVESCLFVVLMTASSPPDKFASTCRKILHALPGLGKGQAFWVGSTLGGGARYQRVDFKDRLGPTPKHVIKLTGPAPLIVPPPKAKERGKGSGRTQDDTKKIWLLRAQGLTERQIVERTGWSLRTVKRALHAFISLPNVQQLDPILRDYLVREMTPAGESAKGAKGGEEV